MSASIFNRQPQGDPQMNAQPTGSQMALDAHLQQIFRRMDDQKLEQAEFRREIMASQQKLIERLEKVEATVQGNVNQMTLWRGVAKGLLWIWGGLLFFVAIAWNNLVQVITGK